MKNPSFLIAAVLAAALLGGPSVLADDGELLRKSMSKAPGQPDTDPVSEAEHAFIDMMGFYVPAQRSDGGATPIEYVDIDGLLVDTRETAKPLIGVYIYGPVEGVEGTGFTGHGKRDAYAAVSLDDGNTWKRTNLSESAEDSSLTVSIPIPDLGAPPGDGDIVVDADTPIIEKAEWDATRRDGTLLVAGQADTRDFVSIRNAVTQDTIFSTVAGRDGAFEKESPISRRFEAPPCYVQAGVDNVFGPALAVENAPEDCIGQPNPTTTAYPGDVINVFQATAGNRAIVAWPSRYCTGGSPNYSLDTSDPTRREAIAAFLGIDLADPSPDDLYLVDLFGVGGQQGSVDYSEDKFEQNRAVGEVPFSCLWVARGTLELDAATGAYEMVWRKAERLTSGRRDVNRVEVKMVAGAGAAITWQEDPEGLRPGQGEGPGEGWSGAIGNSQTDVWYSYVPWESFDLVEDPSDPTRILTYAEFIAAGNENKPKVGIPMAMPLRVTDNAKCNVENPQPYCNGSAIAADHPDVPNPLDYGLRDMCADTIQIPTGKSGSLTDVCVTDDGLPLVGNIAATRPRLGLFGYDSDGQDGVDSAWVVFLAEESKGLGAFLFDTAGNPCDEEGEDCLVADEGKNVWYYSFGMSLTDPSAAGESGLVANLTSHGNMLNQPETDWRTGLFYPVLNTADMWDFGTYNFDIYNTEIARRGSLLAQPSAKAQAGESGLVALPTWKQGIMNQGGPADVMARRILLPEDFDPAVDNPYAFANMVCLNPIVPAGTNPYYPGGLCGEPAINLSGSVPDSCTDSQTGGAVPCPTVDESGIGDTNPILQGQEVEPNTTKVLTWHQCPAQAAVVSASEGLDPVACQGDESNLSDQSWYNPLDVAKGHRGYLDGDFVMLLYGWSPNWRLNAKGSDRFELYIRRSFDGAQSWTTLPSSYSHFDGSQHSGAGTVTCETYRSEETGGAGQGGLDEPHACRSYAAGASEQARNVSQLKSMAFTVLDPRFAPTKASVTADPFQTGHVPTEEDSRDPSRYFIVYESGDNSTTEEGEAEPLDLFYSRGVQFGDDYQVWAEEQDLSLCFPSDPHETEVPEELVGSGFCNEFDDLEGRRDTRSSEASLEANPGGEFLYGVWAQWAQDETGELSESDAMARRVWFIDDYISETEAWTLPGTGDGSQ